MKKTMIALAVLLALNVGTAVYAEKQISSAHQELCTAKEAVDEQIEYLDVVYNTAERYDIEPELAIAMMKIESNFDTSAESSAGCLGLMQVSPIHSTANLLDLRENVECSFSLLSNYINEEESLHEALGRYNRGTTGYRIYVRCTNQTATEYSKKVINLMNELKNQ